MSSEPGVQTVRSTFNRILATVALVGMSGPANWAAPSPLYENTGVTSAPMIDAVTFLNRGVFQVSANDVPYETQNTLYYTNFSGAIIQGGGGFRFDLMPENGFRRPAASFHNDGTISLDSGFGGAFIGLIGLGGFYNNSWILIDATNVVNRGGLTVGSEGLMKIQGENVRLARSGMRAGEDPNAPISPGFISEGQLQYLNDAGVQDINGGAGVNNVLDPAGNNPFNLGLLTGPNASSGPHQVLIPNLTTNTAFVSAPHPFARTNTVSPTNWVVQTIFVDTNSFDPQLKVDVGWGPPRTGDVPGTLMAMVQFTFEDVDTITGEPVTNFVYVLDHLGSLTNAVLYTNFNSTPTLVYQRPSSLQVSRITPPEWAGRVGTNVAFAGTLLVNPDYANQQVTNVYAGYSARIGTAGRISLGGSGVGGGFGLIPELSHPTNLPGRIEIEATNLDLQLARFRSEGLMSVKAANLAPRPPYFVDAPLVQYDVGSTDGPLVVSNLVATTVRRFTGTVSCWSSAWTNLLFVPGPDPADPALQVTNTVEIRFHTLIVSRNFQTIVPVETYRFAGRGEDVHIFDNLAVGDELRIEAPRIEIRGSVSTPEAPDFPIVEELIHMGGLSSSDRIALGTAARPVNVISNSGSMTAPTIEIRADALESSGSITSTRGDLALFTRDLKLEAGELESAASLRIAADDFKAQMSVMTTGTGGFGTLILDVASRLTDGGIMASNQWFVNDGIQLLRRPTEGDLSGTAIQSFLNRFRQAQHVWAGEDRGVSTAGFRDNAALGQLTLDGTPFTLFSFSGPNAQDSYALYVDYLELANSAADVEMALEIAPNFTLYFADSNLPAEELDGALDGRIRWVPDQVGDFSSVSVSLASGDVVRVNRAALASGRIVLGEEGPVSPGGVEEMRVRVRLLTGAEPQAEISWTGMPGRRYRVEYSSDVAAGGWQTLTVCDPVTGDGPASVTVCDTVVQSDQPRFYRVVVEE